MLDGEQNRVPVIGLIKGHTRTIAQVVPSDYQPFFGGRGHEKRFKASRPRSPAGIRAFKQRVAGPSRIGF